MEARVLSMEIYICSHKRFEKKVPEGYQVIYVGPKNFSTANGITDDTGLEIAVKNEFYSELTALYWIWKNSSEDIVGLCHYRRFFVGRSGRLLSKAAIREMLAETDLIVPPKMWLPESVAAHFAEYHHAEDFERMRKVVRENHPAYAGAFEKMATRHWLYPLNMLIGQKTLIDEYCAWLFPLLFQLEDAIQPEKYEGYQRRLLGFLSERLFNVWIEKNQIVHREVYVRWAEKNLAQRLHAIASQKAIMLNHEYLASLSKKTMRL